MNKLKNNLLFKSIIVSIFIISLFISVLSGITTVVLYCKNVLNEKGREKLKGEIIQKIAEEHYISNAVDYYKEFQNGMDTQFYEDYFSEENTNFSFEAKIISDKKVCSDLSNYSAEAYQYNGESSSYIQIYDKTNFINISLPKTSIEATPAYVLCSEEALIELGYYSEGYDKETDYGVLNIEDSFLIKEELYDKLNEQFYQKNGYYYTEEDKETEVYEEKSDFSVINLENNDNNINNSDEEILERGIEELDNHVIINDNHYYILENVDELMDYIMSLYAKYPDGKVSYDVRYDNEEEILYVNATVLQKYTLEISWGIKSKLEAHDYFYDSFELRYIDIIYKYVIPVLIVFSILLIISGALLVIISGHRKKIIVNEKGEKSYIEELKLHSFDYIPYDLVISTLYAFIFFSIALFRKSDYANFESVLMVVFVALSCIIFAFLVMTTAVRLKCNGWKFLKNTIIYRLYKIIKKLLSKALVVLRYLISKLNIFAKYIIVVFLITFIEVLIAINEDAPVVGVTIVVEKIIVAFVLAFSFISIFKIKNYTKKLAQGNIDDVLSTDYMYGGFKEYAKDLNSVNAGIKKSIEEKMKSEMMKTELITNVSHDIKTPLTSIINYVDLLDKEYIDNERVKEYIEVLDRQSQRLKKLIIDLIDASKASTGNIEVKWEKLDLGIILTQLNGEYEEEFEKKNLKIVINNSVDDAYIYADGRHIYRVFDNLFINIKKYAQDNTRVYINVNEEDKYLHVSIKNISSQELNITGDELMERFIRGDKSRNTEGSGLGLSIAKSLIELQNGKINVIVDGDLFKTELFIPRYINEKNEI